MVRRSDAKLRDDRTPSTFTDELSSSTGLKSSVEISLVSSYFATGGVLNNLDSSPLLCCIEHFDYEPDGNHSVVEKIKNKKLAENRKVRSLHKDAEKAKQEPFWESFMKNTKICNMENGLQDIQYIYCTTQDELVSEVTIPTNLVNIQAHQNLRILDLSTPEDSTLYKESHQVNEIRKVPSMKITASAHSTPSLKLAKVPSFKRSGSFFRRISSHTRASPIPHENGLIEI
mmetsp:Transcript_26820/g.56489  ORF Transcript_26820/g.56489 Transcript_26820/m.56489 type:complete len:230 (-) Transcript_26820:4042-4731(-)